MSDLRGHTEREFKLRAQEPIEIAVIDAALRELGSTCTASRSHHHLDTYLDDEHGTLQSHGHGLRARNDGSTTLLTCKSRQEGDGDLVVRRELEAVWGARPLPTTCDALPAALREIIHPLIEDRQLRPWLLLSVQRETRQLQHAGIDLCEAAIDRVEAKARERVAHFQEVELEIYGQLKANQRLADGLQSRLSLAKTTRDKPSHAASLLGLEIDRHPTSNRHK
jgi:inorganic triphosphatase YgiF